MISIYLLKFENNLHNPKKIKKNKIKVSDILDDNFWWWL